MISQYLIFRYVIWIHDNRDVTFSTSRNNFLFMYYPPLDFGKGLSIRKGMALEWNGESYVHIEEKPIWSSCAYRCAPQFVWGGPKVHE